MRAYTGCDGRLSRDGPMEGMDGSTSGVWFVAGCQDSEWCCEGNVGTRPASESRRNHPQSRDWSGSGHRPGQLKPRSAEIPHSSRLPPTSSISTPSRLADTQGSFLQTHARPLRVCMAVNCSGDSTINLAIHLPKSIMVTCKTLHALGVRRTTPSLTAFVANLRESLPRS